MSSIKEIQDAMGPVYSAWLAKDSKEASENAGRYIAVQKWLLENLKEKNEHPGN